MVKNLPACKRPRFDPCVGKSSWRREWLPTPVILPGETRTEEPGGVESMGSQRVGNDRATNTHTRTHTHNYHMLGPIRCQETKESRRSLTPEAHG